MNNTDNHISSWSITDVQKYLRGELSPAEMHRLEKLALDDPFLADALEGLQTHAPVDQDLAELQTRLAARVTQPKKPVSMSWLRMAAAIILLLGLGFTAWYAIVDKNIPARAKVPLVHNEPKTADTTRIMPPAIAAQTPAAGSTTPPATLASPATTPPGNTTAQTDIAEARIHRKKLAEEKASVEAPAAKPAEEKPKAPANTTVDTNGGIGFADRYIADETVKKDTTHEFNKYSIASSGQIFPHRDATMLRSVPISGKPNPPGTANLLVFSGRVLDLNNRPVAGAALFFNGNGNAFRSGAVTDRQGKFNLYLPMEDTTRHLTVAMNGYMQAQYALNTDLRTGNTIYLKENPTQLQEVVISGYGDKRKEARAAPPSDEPEVLDSLWLKTAPAMGRIAYLDYLLEGKKRLSVDSTIQGTESISFLVDQKGTLSDFKIEHSLSPAHDAGLIHLISDGPPWKMIHGKKARAVVNVSFP